MESSTSNVPVNYWDPSNVYPLVAPELKQRLPLRNLHWKSPSRPVRSITSLHVDITPAIPPATDNLQVASASTTGESLSRVRSNDSGKLKSSSPAPATRERRHQIPGLRQTPFLKIFFLRCDDSDSYRSTGRKQLKDWIAQNCSTSQGSSSSSGSNSTTAGGGSGSDRHNAFEWLIVHVVLPGTPAAAQPRQGTTTTSGGAESTTTTSTRWIKSNTTIFDKLKTDFASSSKKVPSRVVQIRLSHPSPAPPPGGVATPTPLPTKAEKEVDFSALINHLKSLILTSFDLRVQQYEDDILARSNQQHLPGWNFCTFFVLKEGLAGAFESVGLIEDAGIIYQELATAGENIIKTEEEGREGGKTFLGWSGDSSKSLVEEGRKWHKRLTLESNKAESNEQDGEQEDEETSILSFTRKAYRELILANNISVFDFLSYVFARQSSLLLRLAESVAPQSSPSNPTESARKPSTFSFYDPTATADELAAAGINKQENEAYYMTEVIRKGLDFLKKASGVLRAELWRAWESIETDKANTTDESSKEDAQILDDKWELNRDEVTLLINNIVSSFNVSGILQLLTPTNHPSLAQLTAKSILLPTPESSLPPPTPYTIAYPPDVASRPITPERQLDMAKIRSTILFTDTGDDLGEIRGPPPKPGVEELAGVRGEAINLAKAIVIEIAGSKWNWQQPRARLEKSHDMVDVDLNEPDSKAIKRDEFSWRWGIKNYVLKFALNDEPSFLKLYERMSENALRLFTTSKRMKSTNRILADLAILKFHLGDYFNAARYLEKLTPKYSVDQWTFIEVSFLYMYARCLMEMGRDDEYAAVVIQLLQQQVMEERGVFSKEISAEAPDDEEVMPAASLALTNKTDILARSTFLPTFQELSSGISVPDLKMDLFWSDISVNPYTKFDSQEGSGGWKVQVKWRWMLRQDMTIGKGVLRLALLERKTGSYSGASREITLENANADVLVRRGHGGMWFKSNYLYQASYYPTSLELTVNKITFIHTFAKPSSSPSSTQSSISLYPQINSVFLSMQVPKAIYLDKLRRVEIVLDPGRAEIIEADLRVKSLTAGLRILVTETQAEGIKLETPSTPGVLTLRPQNGKLGKVKFQIPYKSEGELAELLVRLELVYTTSYGVFTYVTTPSVMVSLPLAVNVQDLFRRNALISKFSISTVSYIPLRVTQSKLEPSDGFEVSSTIGTDKATVVFPKQPASFVYKIVSKEVAKEFAHKPLSYIIEYRCLDEEILRSVETAFVAHLTESSFQKYCNLLLPALRTNIKSLPASEIHAAALMSSVKLQSWSAYAAAWSEILEGVPTASGERKNLAESIKKFHETWQNDNRLPLLEQFHPSFESITRNIVIPVEIPQLQVLCTVHLNLVSNQLNTSWSSSSRPSSYIKVSDSAPTTPVRSNFSYPRRLKSKSTNDAILHDPPLVSVGQVIPAQLIIDLTNVWNLLLPSQPPPSPASAVAAGSKHRFYYEVFTSASSSLSTTSTNINSNNATANSDWLISGRRRGTFEHDITAPANTSTGNVSSKKTFQLLLVPLKPGYLMLPMIEVRSAVLASDGDDGGSGSGSAGGIGNLVTCETDYRSAGKMVLSVAEVESTIVGIDEGKSNGVITTTTSTAAGTGGGEI